MTRFKEVLIMPSANSPTHDYRIEIRALLGGGLLPSPNFKHLYANPSLAVAVAVKSVVDPTWQDVRVVHIPTGEIIFRTGATGQSL